MAIYYYMTNPDRFGCWVTQKRLLELYQLYSRLVCIGLFDDDLDLRRRVLRLREKIWRIIELRELFVLCNGHIKYSNYYG